MHQPSMQNIFTNILGYMILFLGYISMKGMIKAYWRCMLSYWRLAFEIDFKMCFYSVHECFVYM